MDTSVVSFSTEKLLKLMLVVVSSGILMILLLRLGVRLFLEIRKPEVRPSLYCKYSSLSKTLEETLPILSTDYSLPLAFISMPRIVSILSVFLTELLCPSKWTGAIRFLREYLLLKDNSLVSLDWVVPVEPLHHSPLSQSRRGKPAQQGNVKNRMHSPSWIVLLMPGHLVCHSKPSLQFLCRSLVTQGHNAVIVGCKWSDTSDDLRQVIQFLRFQYPTSPIALVGFSHSASLLISYLGEFGSSSLVQAAVAISPFWRIHSEDYKQPFLYHQWVGTRLDPLRDSDDIAVPLLVLNYEDDPLVPSSTLPRELFGLYPHLLLLTCPLGSHCGQLLARPIADVLIVDFLREILPFTNWTSSNHHNQDHHNRADHLRRDIRPNKSCRNPLEPSNHRHRKRVESLSSTIRKPRRQHNHHSARPTCGSC